jgi:hypothetical protein
MPATPRKNHGRQEQLSCEFCRSRKIKCNRVQPCSNCSARGIDCAFLVHPERQSIGPSIAPGHVELLQRIEFLERQLYRSQDNGVTPFDRTQLDGYPAQVANLTHVATPAEQQKSSLADRDVQMLESVGTREEQIASWSQGLEFRQHTSSDILQTTSTAGPKIVAFPLYRVANLLRQNYEANVDSMCKIVHIPSLRSRMESFYLTLEGGAVDLKQAALFLSLFALSAFFCSSSPESDVARNGEETVKLSRALGTSALDVLDRCRRTTSGSLEEVQAYMLMTFVVWQQDGFSARGRSYLATAASIARDIGLHRIDDGPESDTGLTHRIKVSREMKRRVFWYMTSADW